MTRFKVLLKATTEIDEQIHLQSLWHSESSTPFDELWLVKTARTAQDASVDENAYILHMGILLLDHPPSTIGMEMTS